VRVRRFEKKKKRKEKEMGLLKQSVVLLAIVSVVISTGNPKTYDDTYANCINPKNPPSCHQNIHGSPYSNIGKFRTIDGTCNNLKYGKTNWGATNTKLRRLLCKISLLCLLT